MLQTEPISQKHRTLSIAVFLNKTKYFRLRLTDKVSSEIYEKPGNDLGLT